MKNMVIVTAFLFVLLTGGNVYSDQISKSKLELLEKLPSLDAPKNLYFGIGNHTIEKIKGKMVYKNHATMEPDQIPDDVEWSSTLHKKKLKGDVFAKIWVVIRTFKYKKYLLLTDSDVSHERGPDGATPVWRLTLEIDDEQVISKNYALVEFKNKKLGEELADFEKSIEKIISEQK